MEARSKGHTFHVQTWMDFHPQQRETRTEKAIKSVRKLSGKEVKFMTAVMAVREKDSERPHRGRV